MQQPPNDQPYYQPQPPQGYYQPPMPSKPKRPRRWPWIVAILAALFIGYAAGASTHGVTDAPTVGTVAQPAATSNLPAFGNTASSPPTSAPTTQHFSVGQTVKDNDWQITITNVKTSPGQDLDTPKPGNQFLLIDVTLQNGSSSQQTVSSLIMFTLRDKPGQEYTQTLMTSGQAAPNGQADPGQQIKGTLAYEVPTSVHTFTLSFIGNIGEQQVSFDITV